MDKTRKRLNFQCWDCKRNFSLMKEFIGAPKLIVACPFCSASCVADLGPYQRDTIEVTRSDDKPAETGINLDLPEVLPTTQAEEETKR